MNTRFLWRAIAIALLLGSGTVAGAEPDPGRDGARPMPPPGMRMGGGRMQRMFLGINIARPNGGGPVDGVLVEGVTPGGAAEAAGIEAGDVLTQVAGTDLAAQTPREAAARLIGIMEKARPGEPLAVALRRGKESRKVDVTPVEFTPDVFTGAGPGVLPRGGADHDGRRGGYMWRHFGAMPGLELVELTPKLGRYFGTESGILVVRAPPPDKVPIEEGDVILSIGGRTPRDPTHAMQILASYAPGEELAVEVIRDRKKRSLQFRLPEPGPMPFNGRLMRSSRWRSA